MKLKFRKFSEMKKINNKTFNVRTECFVVSSYALMITIFTYLIKLFNCIAIYDALTKSK